jgi:hypothetical protein
MPTATSLEETEPDPAGDYIPGAVDAVVSLGVTVQRPDGWFGGGRLRYFGAAPLIEDKSVRSDPTLLVNLEAGQLLVVAMAFVVWRLFARHTVFVASRTPALYVIGSVAAYRSIGRVVAILS